MLSFRFVTHYLDTIVDTAKNPVTWGAAAVLNLVAVNALTIFIEHYIFSQWHFAVTFLTVFIIDTVNGTYIAIRKGEYSGKLFREKLMDKTLAYSSIIVAFSAGTKMLLQDSETNLIQYLNLPFYSLFIGVEIRSIVNNWYRFKKWKWLGELLKLIDKRNNPLIHEDEKKQF